MKKQIGVVLFSLFFLAANAMAQTELGSSLDVSSPVFLGETIELSGAVLRGLEPVFLDLDINLVNAQNQTVALETISPNAQGIFLFSFHTSFIDSPGTWALHARGDFNGTPFVFSKPVLVEDPLRERSLLVQVLLEKTRVQKGETVGLVVRVSDSERLVDDAVVELTNPLNQKTIVPLESLGEYAVSVLIPFEMQTGDQTFRVQARRDTGILVEGIKDFELEIQEKPFSLELVSPTTKRFNIGDTVDFRVFAQYAFNQPVVDANAFVLVNRKRLELTAEGRGFFGGEFVVSPEEEGSVAFEVVVQDRYANRSSLVGQFEVVGTGFSFWWNQYANIIVTVLVLAIIGVFGARQWLQKQQTQKKWLNRHAELLELEKNIQTQYFEEAALSRTDFLARMEKYETERKQLEQKMLESGITSFEKAPEEKTAKVPSEESDEKK